MTNQLQHQQRRAVDLRIPAIEKYAYCLCLHVKPTTIFIAVFKLIRALLFASMLLNNELSDQTDVPLTSFDNGHRSTAAAVNILTRGIMASVSAVGIYAVISGRAALLMPLYAILLVDFFFALPAFYNRDIDPSFADSMSDFRGYSNGNNQYARYSFMLFSTITMVVKIYFLCVIWKCYRYLRLIELVSPIRLSEIYPHIHQNGHQYPPIVRVLGSTDSSNISSSLNMAPPPYESIATNMKPPNYEEAMKSTNVAHIASSMSNQLYQEPCQRTLVIAIPPPEQPLSSAPGVEANQGQPTSQTTSPTNPSLANGCSTHDIEASPTCSINHACNDSTGIDLPNTPSVANNVSTSTE